ncbi:hypothetical protein O7614_10780 [Micromonospora sp. WMMD961]|uniref:hypothetical protein n=1 Tax=Micromonospora sp. WMMD961 TaxID=3016100 RepID=UPI002417DCF1|nr:hypothetical protein [Micromonospora sp. WMMD961]MDG4780124.1 hypothetical protein [Micromonospora sp. WMMD961]
MNDGVRRAVVAALLQLADSTDYQDRADAGQAMASFVDVAGTREHSSGFSSTPPTRSSPT